MGESAKKTTVYKGLLKNEELYQYILETSVYPREPEPLKELRDATAAHPRAIIATAPDAGQSIDMLLKLVNAKKTIEIGVFTGYSLLLTALSIPDDGKHENEGSLDFAFVDADKGNYKNYHERLMKLLKVGGLVVYDNTLWYGTVALPEDLVEELVDGEYKKEMRKHIMELNKYLATDSRVQICVAPLGDGITICRRIY